MTHAQPVDGTPCRLLAPPSERRRRQRKNAFKLIKALQGQRFHVLRVTLGGLQAVIEVSRCPELSALVERHQACWNKFWQHGQTGFLPRRGCLVVWQEGDAWDA